jgi:hypothetical protein
MLFFWGNFPLFSLFILELERFPIKAGFHLPVTAILLCSDVCLSYPRQAVRNIRPHAYTALMPLHLLLQYFNGKLSNSLYREIFYRVDQESQRFQLIVNCIYWGIFIFYPLIFFLLCPCTTEQWLSYHWWYDYHSLRNPGVDGSHFMLPILTNINIVRSIFCLHPVAVHTSHNGHLQALLCPCVPCTCKHSYGPPPHVLNDL